MTRITTGDGVVIRTTDPNLRAVLREAVGDTDWTVAETGPTGVTGVEPLVAVTSGGRTAYHVQCSTDRVRDVGTALQDSSDPTREQAADPTAGNPDAVVEHDADATGLPAPGSSGLAVGTRAVLGACGWRRPAHPDDHEAVGGFPDFDPAEVREFAADLHGRGWGDWCRDERVGASWDAVRDADEGVVVVNAHGTAADALLLAGAPFEVLDGAVAAARAVGADRVVVYASADDERGVETVREAAANYPDLTVPVDVVTGPAEYRAAEPTMALEAIEGNHRLEARIRPPGPDETGLNGMPTLVHTARTLAQLAVGLRAGALPETRLVTVAGDVDAPATVELPEDEPLSAALDAVDVDGAFKAACVGGRFGGLTGDLEVTADHESLADADLGTEGVVDVLAEGTCVVEFVGERARFAAAENCGRCVPCREGTTQLAEALRDIYDGRYDPDGIAELVHVMETSSICSFGVDAGRPARTALTEFESEFEAHADGRCPAGSCLDALEAA